MTSTFILVAIVVIIIFDVWLWTTNRPTISRVIAVFAQRHQLLLILLVLTIGVLVGHWFWPIVITIC